jgi:hypothetical protein
MSKIQRWAGVVAVCGAALVCGGDKDEKGPKGKPIGPEWVKDGDEYKKKVEGTATREANEWSRWLTHYNMDLTHGRLSAVESDDGVFLHATVGIDKKRGMDVAVKRD